MRTRTSGQGRKKGTPNKATAAIKDMIIKALENAGGVRYLTKQAKENPTAFMGLLGKVLPMQVTGADGGPLAITVVDFAGTKD